MATTVLAKPALWPGEPLDVYDTRLFELLEFPVARNERGIELLRERGSEAVGVRQRNVRLDSSSGPYEREIGFNELDSLCREPMFPVVDRLFASARVLFRTAFVLAVRFVTITIPPVLLLRQTYHCYATA